MAVPLIPFIVLFCHAIETCEATHLENLAAVVEIAHITTDLPDVYRKQLHLFKLMYDVACKYISSRTTHPAVHGSGRIPDTPFEMLFVEAGVPLPAQHDQSIGFGDFPVGEMDQSLTHSMELGNWFEQNQEIFMMLDNNM
jgi:hypothetical protein